MTRGGFDLREQYSKAQIDAKFEANIKYGIGQPGDIGFGVAPAKQEKFEAIGAVPFDGHDSLSSPNRGKYLHVASGAVLYYVPKHYYKEIANTPYISEYPQDGYVLDRSFINAGVELDGIFCFAFGGGNNSGKLTSQAGLDPVSTNSAHNPIGALITAPSNTCGGIYKASKSCDTKAFPTPIWVRRMLGRLALAHGKAANVGTCAYKDVAPYLPKGNNNNALKDANDTSVVFTSSGYSNCALTGSGVPFAKTTHNGQPCGIADLNGNMWEACSGMMYKARTGATGTSGSNAVALTAHGYVAGDKIAFGATPSSGSTYNTAVYTVDIVADADNFTLTATLERDILANDGIYTGKTFYIFKESSDVTALADDSTTSGTGAFDLNLYEQVDLSNLININDSWKKLGNGTEQVFDFSVDRNSNAYKRASLGIPRLNGQSVAGTTEFGNDGIYSYLRNDCVPLAGGHWNNTSYAGVGTFYLISSRTYSYDHVGLRACFLG